jgi:hypothetical protein
VQAWWYDDVATIAAYVETVTERLDTVLDVCTRVAKEVLCTTAASELLYCLRQWAIGLFKVDTAPIAAFIAVFIEYDEARDGASRNTDVCCRPHLPPATNDVQVSRRVLEAVLGAWVLTYTTTGLTTGTAVCDGRMAGKDGPATGCVVQGCR